MPRPIRLTTDDRRGSPLSQPNSELSEDVRCAPLAGRDRWARSDQQHYTSNYLIRIRSELQCH
jgi:hypothetical protein